jgi:RimJ/RimL family protein N-acetyltransferase
MTIPIVPLETQRLSLRPLRQADLPALTVYFTRPDVQRYVHIRARDHEECRDALNMMTREVALNRPGDVLSLAIVNRADREFLGHTSLIWSDATAGQGELRLVLTPNARGEGFGREAAEAMLDLAFDEFRLHRVFARCDGRNARSARLLKGLGMRLEAHFREHALFMGEWDEELQFALLAREWRRSAKVQELQHRIA